MKKTVLLMLLAVSLCLARVVPVRADDADDARKAFDTFVQYTKVDDDRLLALFAPDIAATFFYDAGQGVREITPPAKAFLEMVKEGIAKKDGNTDTYEDVKTTAEGSTVKLTCTRIDGKTGERAPFVVVYARDAAGVLKIKAMRMQVPPPKVTPGQ